MRYLMLFAMLAVPLASLTKEAAAESRPAAAQESRTAGDAADLEAWFEEYDAAFNAKDLDALAAFYDPDVTIYEGGGVNNGWVDYRDHHLGPELKEFDNLEFALREMKVTVLGGGQSAYATARYSLKAKMGERDIDAEGLATYVLVNGDHGWRIRHSHTSSLRRPSG